MLETDRRRLDGRSVLLHPRGRPPHGGRSTFPRPMPEPALVRHFEGIAAENTYREVSVVPRRRGLRPFHPLGRGQPELPGRVRHPLHALPARGEPGDPPGHLRIPDPHLPAHRAWTSPTPPSMTGRRGRPRPSSWPHRLKNRPKVLIAASLHPAVQERHQDLHPEPGDPGRRSPLRRDRRPSIKAALARMLDAETAALILQSPNYFGVCEDIKAAAGAAHGQSGPPGRRRGRGPVPRPARGARASWARTS